MSGLPAGGPNDVRPNWIITAWPFEHAEILEWQWHEKLLPYWTKLAVAARDRGVTKLCIEMHGDQLFYYEASDYTLPGKLMRVVAQSPSGADPTDRQRVFLACAPEESDYFRAQIIPAPACCLFGVQEIKDREPGVSPRSVLIIPVYNPTPVAPLINGDFRRFPDRELPGPEYATTDF
jgi:hypothetical protein